MGTWSSPFITVEDARRFERLLDSDQPVTSREAATAFYQVVGDDGFFDLVGERRVSDPQADVRGEAAAWVKGWLADGPRRWSDPWNDEAVSIASAAVARFEERYPGSVVLPPKYLDRFENYPTDAVRPSPLR